MKTIRESYKEFFHQEMVKSRTLRFDFYYGDKHDVMVYHPVSFWQRLDVAIRIIYRGHVSLSSGGGTVKYSASRKKFKYEAPSNSSKKD